MFEGRRNFNRCRVKTISLETGYQEPERYNEPLFPQMPSGPGARHPSQYYRYTKTTLDCPKTGESTITSTAQLDARHTMAEIRSVAAKALCQNCIFADMTPAELDTSLAEEARAKAARLRAEAELKIAQQEYDEVMRLAHQEVTSIEQRVDASHGQFEIPG